MCMLVPSRYGMLFSAKQNAEFMNVTTYIYVSFGIWTLACTFLTLNLKNPKCIGPICTNFPKPFGFALSLSVYAALSPMPKPYT